MNTHGDNDPKKGAHPLAKLFLENRHLLVLTVVVGIVGGLSALKGLPRLEDPIITNRNPQIITVFPGASAERVESLVTEKIEDELKEIPEIKHIDSISRAGVSAIAIELQDAVSEKTNKQVFSEIRDRLATAASSFPRGVLPPNFDDKRNAIAFSMIVSLTWENGKEESLGILSRQADELAERLRSISGTDLARVYGAPEEEISVTADHHELSALGISMENISAALRQSDAKVPSGTVRGAGGDLPLEVAGELDSISRIREVPLVVGFGNGRTVRLGDVAQVERSTRDPEREVALADGKRAVYVAARVQGDRRVDLWTKSAHEVVEAFADEIGGGIVLDVVFDQGKYTESRLSDLTGNLLLGALVVLAVILITMGWRSSLIVGVALPLTACITLFIVALTGGKLHQMSIFGMIIALGLLIDNAIVMTDEVRKGLARGLSPVNALSAAIRHLFFPLLSSTVTTIFAFMPILLLPGGAGDFVGSIAGSVIVALGVSFFVAVTIIGALAGIFGKPSTAGQKKRWYRDGISGGGLATFARKILGVAVRRPLVGVSAALVIPVIGFVLAQSLGSQFFPRTDRNMFEVEVWLPTGSSIEMTRAEAVAIGKTIREQEEVTRVDWLIGGSFPAVYYNLIMNQDGASHYAHGIVTATDFESVDEMIGGLQSAIDARFPKAQVVVTKFAQGPPSNADVEIRLLGSSIETLQDLGEEVRVILAEHPGILQTQVTMPRGEPKLMVDANEEETRLAGLRLTEVAGQLQGTLDGSTGGTVLEGIEELPIRVRYAKNERDDVTNVAQMNLQVPGDETWVPLSALGEVKLVPELGGITRRDRVRTNKILGFARPDALAIEVADDVLAKLEEKGFKMPAGYRLEVGGESENQADAVGNLMLYLPVILVLTVAVLILSFRSVRIAAILLMVAPLSAGFGLLATWAMQFPLSFNTVIGSMGLMGLAFNSSIVVLAAIRANPEASAGDPGSIVTAVLGSGRHLISTTLTTIGSFLPLLIFIGGQFWPPLAIVLAGGVGGSTLLAMTFTPAMYRLLACPKCSRKKAKRAEQVEIKEGDLQLQSVS